MDGYRSRLARNMERERLRHGQSAEEIARKIDVNKRTYERWEEGEREPQPKNLLALAEAWEVQIDDLRPDLRREAETLDRIELKLNQLLTAAGLPIDPEKVAEQLERVLEAAVQQDSPNGHHTSKQEPASRKK
jgi:transcriptional regulator with XRE-family HTH domain